LRRAARRLRGGTEHELAAGIRTAIEQEGCPEIVVSCNSALGFATTRDRCATTRTVLWLQNVSGPDDVPGFRKFGKPDLIVANSTFTARASAALLGLSDDDVTPLLNAVDLDAFQPRPGYLEKRPVGPLRILLLGRIDPNKGYDRALAGVQLAQEAGIDATVTLAGPPVSWGGDPHMYLDGLTRQLALVGGEYAGHVPRDVLPGFVRRYDVMIVASLAEEPFGLVTLEAMACGLAVISSNRGGLPEACGGAGLLVDPDDPAAIAGAIGLLADPAVLADTKRRSVERASQRSWDHAARDLLDMLGVDDPAE
jgi:glycosyltransferase involved in cell wall biosynthesis